MPQQWQPWEWQILEVNIEDACDVFFVFANYLKHFLEALITKKLPKKDQ